MSLKARPVKIEYSPTRDWNNNGKTIYSYYIEFDNGSSGYFTSVKRSENGTGLKFEVGKEVEFEQAKKKDTGALRFDFKSDLPLWDVVGAGDFKGGSGGRKFTPYTEKPERSAMDLAKSAYNTAVHLVGYFPEVQEKMQKESKLDTIRAVAKIVAEDELELAENLIPFIKQYQDKFKSNENN